MKLAKNRDNHVKNKKTLRAGCSKHGLRLTITSTLEIPRVTLFHAKINELTTWLTRRVNLPILPG